MLFLETTWCIQSQQENWPILKLAFAAEGRSQEAAKQAASSQARPLHCKWHDKECAERSMHQHHQAVKKNSQKSKRNCSHCDFVGTDSNADLPNSEHLMHTQSWEPLQRRGGAYQEPRLPLLFLSESQCHRYKMTCSIRGQKARDMSLSSKGQQSQLWGNTGSPDLALRPPALRPEGEYACCQKHHWRHNLIFEWKSYSSLYLQIRRHSLLF